MIPVEPTAEHPMPFDLSDEEPKTHKDAVAVAVNTADLLEQLGGDIHYSNNDLQKAAELITGTNKPNTPKHITSTAEAKAAHAIIKEFDFTAFADALQARNFITNKLVSIASCGDPKTELKALELLGKHSDIGLFTERSEITINHTTSDALEKSIKERVKRLLNADVTDVPSRLIDELDDLEQKKTAKTPEQALQEAVENEEPKQEGWDG
jgi:hypothetical protein